jgi:hypothetical protein
MAASCPIRATPAANFGQATGPGAPIMSAPVRGLLQAMRHLVAGVAEMAVDAWHGAGAAAANRSRPPRPSPARAVRMAAAMDDPLSSSTERPAR